ncbi:MAG: hypothetical protein AAFX06_28815 [Planctomycetota bacterium]
MGFDHTIRKGTAGKIVEVMLRDSSTGQGVTGLASSSVTASYVREGGTRVAISLAAGLPGDAHSAGKWAEVDATNARGLYQLHLPDAALADGADAVTVTLQASGTLDKAIRISLIDVDLRDAAAMGLSVLGGKVNATDNADGTFDLAFRNAGDTATLLTVRVTPATGARVIV